MTGGVYSRRELLADGMSDRDIRAARAGGRIRLIRRGWYAGPTAHPWVVQAIRAGGRLGCLSGCRLYGVWTPTHDCPHILLPQGLTVTAPVTHRIYEPMPVTAVYPLLDCLAQTARHHGEEEILTVVESATQSRLIHPAQARMVLRQAREAFLRLGGHLRKVAGTAQDRCPSASAAAFTQLRSWNRENPGVRASGRGHRAGFSL